MRAPTGQPHCLLQPYKCAMESQKAQATKENPEQDNTEAQAGQWQSLAAQKNVDTPEHTAINKHGPTPRGEATLKILKDKRGKILVHQKGKNI